MWFSTELPPVNPDLTTDITILKEVEGPMGDFQKEFCFTYSYVSGNGETITGDFVLKDSTPQVKNINQAVEEAGYMDY